MAYHLWLLKNESVLASRATQNITVFNNYVTFFTGYGLLIVLALIGLYVIYTKYRNQKLPLKHQVFLAWLITATALIFLPNQFQTRYTEGYHILLVLFSTYALIYLAQKWKSINFKKQPAIAIFLFAALLSGSVIFNISRDLYYFNVFGEYSRLQEYIVCSSRCDHCH